MRFNLSYFLADRFNRIDLPAATFSLVSVVLMRYGDSETARPPTLRSLTRVSHHRLLFRVLPLPVPLGTPLTSSVRSTRAIAVLLLWLRIPRLFLLSTRRGPLVLMLFRMVSDVISFLSLLGSVLLSFAAVRRQAVTHGPWGHDPTTLLVHLPDPLVPLSKHCISLPSRLHTGLPRALRAGLTYRRLAVESAR